MINNDNKKIKSVFFNIFFWSEFNLEKILIFFNSGKINKIKSWQVWSLDNFFNVSKFDLSRITDESVLIDFNNYVQGYSKNVLDIIENFQINPLVEKLHKNKSLYLLINKFTEFDFHPSKIDNHQMGSIYEELLRRFSEMSNEESGDHFTPRDVVKLLVNFVFGGDTEDLSGEGKIRSIFDRETPCVPFSSLTFPNSCLISSSTLAWTPLTKLGFIWHEWPNYDH